MQRSTRAMTTAITSLAFAALIAFAPSAFAARPSGGGSTGGGGHKGGSTGGSGTISLVLVNSTDGQAHYGQTVSFNISTTATTQPWVHLQCYQAGAMVAEGWDGYFDGSLSGRNFGLYSPSWSSGAADCTGSLTTPDHTVLASTSFHVYA